jgi:hypothetical protein
MKKGIIIIVLTVFCICQSNAQTGIGTTTPNPSAKLDVYATDKGFLPPRVTLTSVTDATTIPFPATGLLVYNIGSVGLQSGYYYWNGASWATIATSSIAGSGVVASDLVKLYQEAYSTTAGKASSTDGYSFTVPVSGRYEFNFNCTGWNSNGGTIKLTFNVRQGTTVLASDYHQSISSNIWAEYEGRVEVNLNAGTTYNVQVVTTTGYRDYRDWDKIMYKQVAGNLPVNVYPWVLSGNDVYNTSGKVGIGTSSPATTLDVNGALNLSNTTTTPSINVKNGDAAATFNDNAQIKMGWAGSAAGTSQYAQFIHTRHNAGPTNNAIDFYLSDGTANNTITTGSTRAMSILSPGDVEISGKLTIGNASGNVATKVSGFVNAGTFLSMDNLKVSVTMGGSRGLSVGAVSTNFTANISAYYAMNGGVAGSAAANVAYTTTPSGAAFGWSFPSEGDGSYYNILDKTNNRMYRVTLFIGASYLNNFISIERLY